MKSRKENKTKKDKRNIIIFSIPLVILVICTVCDLIWSSKLMEKSISYSYALQKHEWLKYPMFFFSYILFFGIFICKYRALI